MNRALQIAHLLVLLAVIAFLCVIGWRAWTLADEMEGVLQSVPVTEQKLNIELDEAHRLTLEAGLTAMEARQASAEELKVLPKWDAQISELFGEAGEVFGEAGETFSHADETIAAIRGTASAATQTLHGASLDLSTLNDSIAAAKPLLDSSTVTVKHLDAAISDPAIAKIESNAVSMTDSGQRILGDAVFEADKYAHPPKKKLTFWGAMWAGAQFVHKLEPPIF